MTGFPILSLMLLVPLVGAGLVLKASREQARLIALVTPSSISSWASCSGALRRGRRAVAVPGAGRSSRASEWKLGIDGIALLLIALTVFLMPICIGASWNSIEKRAGEYYAAFLLMETLMIGVFTAQDMFLFYIMFEAGLIPMYLIIGIWGGRIASTPATSSSSTRCSARC
jgi:NADH-quinone oxidoreductase subunit M